MTSPASAAPSVPDDVALPRELTRLLALPTDAAQLIVQLERLARLAIKYKALLDATHDAIARQALHGQAMSPKVTQERIAAALGVTGPRVNAIVKAARTRYGDPLPAVRPPREPVDTTA